MAEMNERYSGRLKLRQIYLFNRTFQSRNDSVQGVEVLVADYYFHRNNSKLGNVSIFMFPGKHAVKLDTITSRNILFDSRKTVSKFYRMRRGVRGNIAAEAALVCFEQTFPLHGVTCF